MFGLVGPVVETSRDAMLAHHLSANITEAVRWVKEPLNVLPLQVSLPQATKSQPDRRREALTWERGAKT